MFIVFEGIPKCGKTTQITRLIEWLKDNTRVKLYKTGEPQDPDLARLIQEAKATPIRELDLRMQDRKEHFKYILKPMLDCGFWVFSDGFALRDVAHFGYGDGLDIPRINRLSESATEGLKPDLTIVLDCCIENAIDRGIEFEHNRIYLEKIRMGYLEVARKKGYTIVNGNLHEDAVFNRIKDTVIQFLPEEDREFIGVKLFV